MALSVPRAERIVAEDRPVFVDLKFGVIVNPRPPDCGAGCVRVIVAAHEVFRAVEPLQERLYLRRPARHVAQAPSFVLRFDHRVPALDQQLIHLAVPANGLLQLLIAR
jgi:hypothetical protein